MIELEFEMTYAETIKGPLGPTTDSPLGERPCWQVTTATLSGPRIDASVAAPGIDWIRLGADGIRRPDLRAQLVTDDGELILLRYDLALIRSSERFLAALAAGEATEFEDQYMRMSPQFEVGAGRYAWLCESLFLGRGRLTGPTRLHTSSTACSERVALHRSITPADRGASGPTTAARRCGLLLRLRPE